MTPSGLAPVLAYKMIEALGRPPSPFASLPSGFPKGRRMSGDTLFRQWTMIHLIPREPWRKSTTEIHKALEGREFKVTVRTVQRDLLKLKTVFSYLETEEGRTFYWHFPKSVRLLEVPAMDAGVALTFSLAEEHLAPALPPMTLSLISPYFARAQEVLNNEVAGDLGGWKNRLRVISRGPKLGAPKIAEGVQHCIYDAVLRGLQVSVTYRARGGKASNMDWHPLALVLHEGVPYVVATAFSYTDVRYYALHRITACALKDEKAQRPANFNLDEYVEQTFRYQVSPNKLRLVAKFNADSAKHLLERPLSADQTAKEVGFEIMITANVQDTEELRWWLLGMGDNVEVLEPQTLRADLKQRIAGMAAKYHG